mgnify:CR=1 FL=1
MRQRRTQRQEEEQMGLSALGPRLVSRAMVLIGAVLVELGLLHHHHRACHTAAVSMPMSMSMAMLTLA